MVFVNAHDPNTDWRGVRMTRKALMLGMLALFQGACSYEQASKREVDSRNLRVEVGNSDNISNEAPELNGTYSLKQCLELALEQNHKRPASRFAVAMAEAQHGQALAAYWPQLTLQGNANLRSDDPNYIFPAQSLALPETAIPFGGQQFVVPEQNFYLAEQEIKTMDRVTYGGKLDAKWLLVDGGGRAALREQAKLGVEAAEQDARRTDLDIVYDVRRMYFGAVLARQVEEVGRETLEKMEATLELTEQLYQGGSMKVKKTDYLRNKVLVEGLRGMIEKLKQNRMLAEAALSQAMGLSWRSSLQPKDRTLSFERSKTNLEGLVSDLYQFNPNWKQLQIAIDAAEAKIREEKSGLYPVVAFIGNLHAGGTDHDTGTATDSNLNAWNVGIGVEMPLWDGLLTRHRVDEAKARLGQVREQRIVMKEGLAAQLKAFVIKLDSMQAQEGYAAASEASATENRELTEKAYRNDLIEADKVFQAQLMEAISEARRLKLRYDHKVQKAQIDLVVGRDIQSRLGLDNDSAEFVAGIGEKK